MLGKTQLGCSKTHPFQRVGLRKMKPAGKGLTLFVPAGGTAEQNHKLDASIHYNIPELQASSRPPAPHNGTAEGHRALAPPLPRDRRDSASEDEEEEDEEEDEEECPRPKWQGIEAIFEAYQEHIEGRDWGLGLGGVLPGLVSHGVTSPSITLRPAAPRPITQTFSIQLVKGCVVLGAGRERGLSGAHPNPCTLQNKTWSAKCCRHSAGGWRPSTTA